MEIIIGFWKSSCFDFGPSYILFTTHYCWHFWRLGFVLFPYTERLNILKISPTFASLTIDLHLIYFKLTQFTRQVIPSLWGQWCRLYDDTHMVSSDVHKRNFPIVISFCSMIFNNSVLLYYIVLCEIHRTVDRIKLVSEFAI